MVSPIGVCVFSLFIATASLVSFHLIWLMFHPFNSFMGFSCSLVRPFCLNCRRFFFLTLLFTSIISNAIFSSRSNKHSIRKIVVKWYFREKRKWSIFSNLYWASDVVFFFPNSVNMRNRTVFSLCATCVFILIVRNILFLWHVDRAKTHTPPDIHCLWICFNLLQPHFRRK